MLLVTQADIVGVGELGRVAPGGSFDPNTPPTVSCPTGAHGVWTLPGTRFMAGGYQLGLELLGVAAGWDCRPSEPCQPG